MLNDFRQYQFALARYLRDPLSAPAPEGVNPADAYACTQAMVNHLCDVLEPAFTITRALLGDELWQHAVRLFLKEANCHAPWPGAVQRAFVDHVCSSPNMQDLPAWLQDLAHFEWLQNAVSTAPATWPAHDAAGDVMHHPVILNPTHTEAAYEWPVHTISTDNKPDDMQTTHVSVLRTAEDELRVFESSVFRVQLLELLRNGQTGEQAFLALAVWLSHPDPQTFMREGAEVMAQLRREGVLLGTRLTH